MSAERWSQLQLAAEPSFELGGSLIEPATRQLSHGGARVTLEPRVMQVLVVLARPAGRVVSRDELIARCWDGRVVGDNAINRSVSQLRHLASTLGDAGFAIDTIARVGYRLTPAAAAAAPPVPTAPAQARPPAAAQGEEPPRRAPPARRRWLVLGGVVASLGGLAGLATAWQAGPAIAPWRHREAARLRDRGQEAMNDGSYFAGRQAVQYLQESVRLEPGSAQGWALLALAAATVDRFDADPVNADLREVARQAIEHTLALDPGSADAEVARFMMQPLFRRWAQVQADGARLLRRHGPHPLLVDSLGIALTQTGHWRRANAAFEQVLDGDRSWPATRARRAVALWSTGRVDEAERAYLELQRLWPQHRTVWESLLRWYMFSGRLPEAVAMLEDWRRHPAGRIPLPVPVGLQVLHALGQARPEAVAAAAQAVLAARARGEMSSLVAVPMLTALGRLDDAFAQLGIYYFGGPLPGRVQPPPPAGALRDTNLLFMPPLAPLRDDARFAALTAALGLDDYWRVSGTGPDVRRPQGA